MSDQIVFATRALVRGTMPENALGPEVQMALRGYRSGMVRAADLLTAVAAGIRHARVSLRFDAHGNPRKF